MKDYVPWLAPYMGGVVTNVAITTTHKGCVKLIVALITQVVCSILSVEYSTFKSM